VIGRLRIVEALERATDGEDAVGIRRNWSSQALSPLVLPREMESHVQTRFRIGCKRVAAKIPIWQRIMPEQGAVVVPEPIVEIVAHSSHLADAGQRFDFARVRPIAEVATTQVDFLAGLPASHFAAEQAAAPVEPAVKAPGKAVHSRLIIVRG